MLRFILEHRTQDNHSGLQDKSLHTLVADVPELEKLLTQGGSGPSGYDRHILIGCEVVELPDVVSEQAVTDLQERIRRKALEILRREP